MLKVVRLTNIVVDNGNEFSIGIPMAYLHDSLVEHFVRPYVLNVYQTTFDIEEINMAEVDTLIIPPMKVLPSDAEIINSIDELDYAECLVDAYYPNSLMAVLIIDEVDYLYNPVECLKAAAFEWLLLHLPMQFVVHTPSID